MLKRLLVAFALWGLAPPAYSQILQSGSVTPGHIPVWTSNGILQDGGTAANPNGLTSLGITNNGGPALCANSAPIIGAYNSLCFSVSSSAPATISLQNYGGATSETLNFLINGISYPFPGSLSTITLGTTPINGGPVNGSCLFVNGTVVGQQTCSLSSISALTGDVTATGPGSAAATLATVNPDTGTFGSSVAIPIVTVNNKGLITSISTAGIASVAANTLTGTTLASNVVNSSLTTVGTIATGVWQGTILAPGFGGTGVNNNSNTLTLAASLTTTGTATPTLAFPTGSAYTYTFPAATDTVTLLAASQTLTNKTINGATLSGTIAGSPTLSGSNFVTLANIVQDGTGYSLLGNVSSGSANYAPFTIGSLSLKATPGASDLVMIQDVSASGQIKYTTVSAVAAGATVSSVNGLTGALTIAGCSGASTTITCPQGVAGDARNLKIVQGSTTTLTVTADEILTETSLGATIYKEASASHTLTITNTGANGMDTGSAPTSGFICVYSITKGDGSTFAVLGSNAATNACSTLYPGASMPSGYVASALIGIWPTDGSAHVVVGLIQSRKFWYQTPKTISSSLTGSATLTSLSIASGVPATVTKTVDAIVGTVSSHGGSVTAAGDGTGIGAQGQGASTGALFGTAFGALLPGIALVTSQIIYWTESGANTGDIVAITAFTW